MIGDFRKATQRALIINKRKFFLIYLMKSREKIKNKNDNNNNNNNKKAFCIIKLIWVIYQIFKNPNIIKNNSIVVNKSQIICYLKLLIVTILSQISKLKKNSFKFKSTIIRSLKPVMPSTIMSLKLFKNNPKMCFQL